MADTKESKQIRQMINFIMQEAHEKSNEIRLKAEHDYQLEIQNLVHTGKVKVQEDYAQKAKDLEIKERVELSNAVASSRVKKMKSREDLLMSLKDDTLAKLSAMTKTPAYEKLLQGLLVEGLCKLQEVDVQVMCLEKDEKVLKKVLSAATEQARKKMSNMPNVANELKSCTVSTKKLANKGITGGIVLVADGGRIELDQTLDERLSIAFELAMPSIRGMLFSSRA